MHPQHRVPTGRGAARSVTPERPKAKLGQRVRTYEAVAGVEGGGGEKGRPVTCERGLESSREADVVSASSGDSGSGSSGAGSNKKARKGKERGRMNWKKPELMKLLDFIEEVLPTGQKQ